MSSSEIAFLALGLLLGVTVGAVLLASAWSRSEARREVRVTISPNSIRPGRAATVSELAAARDGLPPFCSPDDAAWPDRPAVVPAPAAVVPPPGPTRGGPMRTHVPDTLTPTASGWVLPTNAVAIDVSRWTAAGVAIPVGGVAVPIGGVAVPVERIHWPGHPAGSATVIASPPEPRGAVAVKPVGVATVETWAMTPILDAGWSPERAARLRAQRVEAVRPAPTGTAVGIVVARAEAAAAERRRRRRRRTTPPPATPVVTPQPRTAQPRTPPRR